MDGMLPVFKPAGWTSHDVVAKVRRLLQTKRIGHTGTLDPQVTGVLPLCIGRATRFVEYVQELSKEYEAKMEFGYATDTEDATGEVIQSVDEANLTETQIRQTLESFVGVIEQIPPMFSAVKVNGKRLYELARQGQQVERKPRSATIYEIEVISVDTNRRYPELAFRVRCSKGTYIRTLCVDIGQKLGLPAVMTSLVRTATGPYALEHCVTIEELEEASKAGRAAQLLRPSEEAVAHFRKVVFPDADAKPALTGKHMPLRRFALGEAPPANGELIRMYDQNEKFLGLYRLDTDAGRVIPEKVFLTPDQL